MSWDWKKEANHNTECLNRSMDETCSLSLNNDEEGQSKIVDIYNGTMSYDWRLWTGWQREEMLKSSGWDSVVKGYVT